MSFSEVFATKRLKGRCRFYEQVDFLMDCKRIESLFGTHYAPGREAYSVLLLFKILLIGIWNGLSDREVEEEVSVNLKAMRFCGLNVEDELTAQLAILANSERDGPGNTIRLMTLHSPKGLEFRFVNIIGLEDGALPHESGLIENRLEEEPRLIYVGVTRAKEHLTLSFAARKRRFRGIIKNTPSRFLKELPKNDLNWSGRDVAQDQIYAQEIAASPIARLSKLLKAWLFILALILL